MEYPIDDSLSEVSLTMRLLARDGCLVPCPTMSTPVPRSPPASAILSQTMFVSTGDVPNAGVMCTVTFFPPTSTSANSGSSIPSFSGMSCLVSTPSAM